MAPNIENKSKKLDWKQLVVIIVVTVSVTVGVHVVKKWSRLINF